MEGGDDLPFGSMNVLDAVQREDRGAEEAAATLDLKNPSHVGHSTGGGEVARYVDRHWPLALDSTRVGDAGLAHLETLTKLQFLELSDTKVTDEGVKKLRKLLPKQEGRDEPTRDSGRWLQFVRFGMKSVQL